MNLDKQVCSLEFANRLKEIGINQKSLFHWWNNKNNLSIYYGNIINDPIMQCSAFTASELGEILPNVIYLKDKEPFDRYTISIKKFYSVDENRLATNNYIINYECDSTSVAGEDAWLQRKLCKNIYNPNLADAMAEMLIFLTENKLI